jgi:hypothetical protein
VAGETRQATSAPETERYVIIAGGDGYQTATVTGREAMEQAFVRAHWPDADFSKLSEDEQQTLACIQDEDEWAIDFQIGRTNFTVRYEDGWVSVYRLLDNLVGVYP